jgi:hypothetical protein
MKSLKIFFSSFIILGFIVIASCGDSGSDGSKTDENVAEVKLPVKSSPSDVLIDAIENMADGDYEDVVEAYVRKNGEELTKEEKAKMLALLPSGKQDLEKKGGLKEVTIVEDTISQDGTTATVKFKKVYKDGKEGRAEKANLLLVDGKWKLKFN